MGCDGTGWSDLPNKYICNLPESVIDHLPAKKEIFRDRSIGEFDWHVYGPARMYLPKDVKIIPCPCCDFPEGPYNHFAMYLPDSEHYVTVKINCDETTAIQNRLSFLLCTADDLAKAKSKEEKASVALLLTMKHSYFTEYHQNIDWYMENKWTGGHLLMEHVSRPCGRERLACIYVLDNGVVVQFRMDTKYKIDEGTIEYFWQMCRLFKLTRGEKDSKTGLGQ